MHRVFKLKSDQLRQIHNLISYNRLENNLRLVADNNVSSNNSVRYQSTNVNPSVKQKKVRKKRTRSTKKYAELLVGECIINCICPRFCHINLLCLCSDEEFNRRRESYCEKAYTKRSKNFHVYKFRSKRIVQTKKFFKRC